MATKKHLINKVSANIAYLSKEDITESVDFILAYLAENLSENTGIEIRGFGSFSVRKRKYLGKNEQYNTVYYRMSKSLVSSLNNKPQS